MKKIATNFLHKLLKIKSYEQIEKIYCTNLIKSKLIDLKFEVEIFPDLRVASFFHLLDIPEHFLEPQNGKGL